MSHQKSLSFTCFNLYLSDKKPLNDRYMKIATLFLFIPLSLNMLYGQENAKTKIVNLEKKFATSDSKY